MPRLINLRTMSSRKRRPPKEKLEPWQAGKSSRRILEYLRDYRYLTSELLAVLYAGEHGRGQYHVQHELTRLWRHGLAERHFRPSEPGLGSNQYVYTLSVEGAQLVVEPEHWAEERHKIYNRAAPKVGYEHALAVALLQILWDLGSASQSDLFQTVATWQDKEGVKKETRNHFEARVAGQKVSIQPDLTIVIAHQQRDFYRPYFFEVEKTTKNKERLRQRFLAYRYLLSRAGEDVVAKTFKREFDEVPSRGIAVFVGADARHAEGLRIVARSVVPNDTEFWFTSLESLFETKAVLRKDEKVRMVKTRKKTDDDPQGENLIPLQVETPIAPEEFFTRNLLVNLDGKPGKLVV